MKQTYNLNFHQTFPPTKDFMSRLLCDCPKEQALTKEEISDLTGIPTGASSGKVEPHIHYAEYMRLLKDDRKDGKHCIELTELGNTMLEEDPGLNDLLSIVICHLGITSSCGGAPLWRVLFREILPKYPRGISDVLLADELEKFFGTPVKIGPLFSSYQGFFSCLNALKREKNITKLGQLPYDMELIYAYAYELLYEWECIYPGRTEITGDELLSLGISYSLGWSDSQFYVALEEFAEREIIQFNRQLTPYTIIKAKNSTDMIPILYSELC